MKRLLAGFSVMGSVACGPTVYCIARGAQVRVPGGTRLIEELREGDHVVCVDPVTGVTAEAMIFAVVQARRECVRLTTAQGALVATSDHPVYSPERKAYVPAGDWVTGQCTQLLSVCERGIVAVNVDVTSAYAGVFDVFDITVDHPLHNFIANGFVVHNKSKAETPCPTVCSLNGLTVQQGAPCACAEGSMGTAECRRVSGPVCLSCQGSSNSTDGGEPVLIDSCNR